MAEIQVLVNPIEVNLRPSFFTFVGSNDIFDVMDNDDNCLGHMQLAKFNDSSNVLRMRLKGSMESHEIKNINHDNFETAIHMLLTSFNFVLRKDNNYSINVI